MLALRPAENAVESNEGCCLTRQSRLTLVSISSSSLGPRHFHSLTRMNRRYSRKSRRAMLRAHENPEMELNRAAYCGSQVNKAAYARNKTPLTSSASIRMQQPLLCHP